MPSKRQSAGSAPAGLPDAGRLRIGLVGYGEVGRIVAEDLRAQRRAVAAYDLKLAQAGTAASLRDHAGTHGVLLAASHAELAARSDLVEVDAPNARQRMPGAADHGNAVFEQRLLLQVLRFVVAAQRAQDEVDVAAAQRRRQRVVRSFVGRDVQPGMARQQRRDRARLQALARNRLRVRHNRRQH